MLSGKRIQELTEQGVISISDMKPSAVQPASIDLHLGKRFLTQVVSSGLLVPAAKSSYPKFWESKDVCILRPGSFVLAHTSERVELPHDIAGRVEGKSSLARIGLGVHITAGFIDPGFDGHITLELHTFGNRSIELVSGMPISQLSLYMVEHATSTIYNGKYQHSDGVVESKYYENWDAEKEEWK